MELVPFWVQIHSLLIRAMNKKITESEGATLGMVLEVYCDAAGVLISKCSRVKVLLNVHNPIIRWTNLNFGGCARNILFRYKKLADFCYLCGWLDHLQKACSYSYPNSLRHYGPRLRANGTHPTSLEEAARDLNRMNAHMLIELTTNSPHTPAVSGPGVSSPSLVAPVRSKALSKGIPVIPLNGILSTSSFPLEGPHVQPTRLDAGNSPPPGFDKPRWEVSVPIQKNFADETKGKEKMTAHDNDLNIINTISPGSKGIPTSGEAVNKELNLSFLQNFYFSPALSLHQPGSNYLEGLGLAPPFNLEDPLIPLKQLVRMVSPQMALGTDGTAYPKKELFSRFISAPTPDYNSTTLPFMQDSLAKKKNLDRKWILIKPKARSAPCKKMKTEHDELGCTASVSSTTDKAVAGSS